jgi:type III restriction enzyme
MSRRVNSIAGSLSLRTPQRRSLEILDRVYQIAKPGRGQDLGAALEVIGSEFPEVRDFERPFVNLCFALATGVGKTRLMGAFISYLYLEHGVRHFLVLAPNLTIYRKLIADFTPGHPKYVLQGVAELAVQPPVVVTGDNWESGVGVRAEAGSRPGQLFDAPVHINIFNSAKLVARGSAKEMRRLRAVQETIGESYFDYLAGLDDLVILMDEAHRYRAEGAMEAIVELKPALGIELTATPQVEQGGKKDAKGFANVVYRYTLADAMRDGYVKQPAVATKEGMQAADARKIAEGTLDRIKLEDGVRVHEATKVELDTYARNHQRGAGEALHAGHRAGHAALGRVGGAHPLRRVLRGRLPRQGHRGALGSVGRREGREHRAAAQCRAGGQPDRDRRAREHAQGGLGRHEPVHDRALGRRSRRRWWSSRSAGGCDCRTASRRAMPRWIG